MQKLFFLIAIIFIFTLPTYANEKEINNNSPQRNLFCGGNGTETDPYQICTIEELAALADYVNVGNGNDTRGVYYKLMNDLDMGYYLSAIGPGYNGGAGWKPIGLERYVGGMEATFQGNFNGNHKIIYNLTINRPYEAYIGLFGHVVHGTIQNLGLKNGNITGYGIVGSLVGYLVTVFSDYTMALVSNCFALCCNVQGERWVGGLVGAALSARIDNSYYNGNVTGEDYVGGLTGRLHINVILSNCYTSGDVMGKELVAGLSGYIVAEDVIIKNCIAANSSVIATSHTNSINRIAIGVPNIYYNNYANNEMVLQANGIDVEIIDGSGEAGTGKDFTTFQSFDFYNTDTNWHTSSLWSIDTEPNADVIWRIVDQSSLPFFQWQKDNRCLRETIAYVDHTKNGDGSSWANAYPNLADPLLIAAKQRSGAIEVDPNDTIRAIYVAEGTYFPLYSAENYNFAHQIFPEIDGGRNNAFVLVAGVKIYGGFVPEGLPDGVFPPFGSPYRNGTTILSGNINGNNEDNAYHVVICADILNGRDVARNVPTLDGVTISGGNADASDNYQITVNNHVIPGQYGGGIFNCYSSPQLHQVTVSGNTATLSGGGIMNRESLPTLINVAIQGNSAGNTGGGMMNESASPQFTNVTITGNRAGNSGGGMHNSGQDFDIEINNSIIWGNSATTHSNIHNNSSDGSVPVYAYSIIQGSGGSSNWENSFGTDGGNNIDEDPLFEYPVSPLAAPTTEGIYNLQYGSPAISAGSNELYLLARNIIVFAGETDVAGNPRLVWSNIDMGAYEAPKFLFPQNGILYVDHRKSGSGSSWADAYPNLADPLILAAKQRSGTIVIEPSDTIREIYVAEGTYYPMYNADNYHFINKIFPETNGNRNNAFVLVAGIKIYGGFVPDEIPAGIILPNFGKTGRNGVTELSGNINGTNIDNAHHILIGVDIPENSNTVIDGFTITGGNGDVKANSILINDIMIFRHCGGGMYNANAAPVLNHIDFNTNIANIGGGIYNASSAPVLTNVTIRGNRAEYGGGIYNDFSSPILTNVAITGNRANMVGGGIFNTYSSPVITNTTISGNRVSNVRYGGGICNDYSAPIINNSIIYGNATSNVYHYDTDSMSTFKHSLIGGSGGSDNWDSSLGIDGGNNIDADPLFMEPVSPTLAPTLTGNYNIEEDSPCVSAGSNQLYLTARNIANFIGENDLAGNPRLSGKTIDMGAYEWQWQTYTITATAGTGGTINPSGTITVTEGDDQTFNFMPDASYETDRVLIDGGNNAEALVSGSYTFTNIMANHTINALFKPIPDGFIPVIEIIDVPFEAWVGTPHRLLSKVIPEDATYQAIVWSIKDTGTTEARLVGRTLTAPKKGTVVVTATIANGTAKGENYTQDFAVEVKVPYNPRIRYNIYPNPTTGELVVKNLNLDVKFEKISIYNIIGELITSFEPVYEEPAEEGIIIADISPASAGVYLVVITTDKGVATGKVVKR